jgi:hypothetical protein
MNPIQEAYKEARDRETQAEARLRQEETAYIRRHEIKNRDGTAPARLEDLDDPERALNFIGDFYCIAPEDLLIKLEAARYARVKAEENLIVWGLSVMPTKEAAVISEGTAKYAAYRRKAVQLFMDLADNGGRK